VNAPRDMDGGSAHRATQECLPWLLSGRLGAEEAEAAQAHLLRCIPCQADLATLRRLREAAALPDPQCDPDAALARLLSRIDAAQEAPPGVAPAPTTPAHSARGLLLFRRAANDPHWLRRAALVQCCLIVLLAVLLAWPGDAVDAYRGLGAAAALQGQVVIVFRPDTPEHELRRIVQASGARIIDGPTVTDAWVASVPEGQSARLLARLRAEPAVLFAEPLGSEGRP
jgi:hypothetical protein